MNLVQQYSANIQTMVKHASSLLCVALGLVLLSCNSDECDPTKTSELTTEVSTLGSQYLSSPTDDNCEDYRDALESLIDELGNCDDTTASSITGFQSMLDALPCN